MSGAVPPELELALLLTRTRAAREASSGRIRELAARCDPAHVAATLDRRRLLPLLGGRLQDIAGDALAPALAKDIATAHARYRAEAMELEAQTLAMTAALAERGIAAVPLKGPAMAARVHGDIGLRSSGDIDLLVAPDDLRAAAAVACSLGYGAPRDGLDRAGLPLLHLTLRDPGRPDVELHWRVHWHEAAFSTALALRSAPGPDGVLVPDPVDEVAALLLFHARDGFVGLRLAADISGWAERHAAGRGPGLLDEHVARHRALARTWRAAAVAAASTTGVPAGFWLSSAHEPGRRERTAVRLTSWSGRGNYDQLVANVALVDGLLTPTASLHRFAGRAARGAPGAVVPHLAKLTARSAVALLRVRREAWDPPPAGAAPQRTAAPSSPSSSPSD